jgi:signal transduction histidine kinase
VAPNLLTLFAEPSVALLYYMLVIALSCAAFFMALGQRMRGKEEAGAGRYARATFGITLAWLALMVGAVGVLLAGQPPDAILPPLDRAVGALVAAFAGWAFVTADRMAPKRFGRAQRAPLSRVFSGLFWLLSGLILAGYVYSALTWFNRFTPGMAFNTDVLGIAWLVGAGAVTLFMGLAVLLNLRRIYDAPLKLIFFLILLAGYFYTGFAVADGQLAGSYSGALRLAFLAAMLLLPVILYRMVIERLSSMMVERAAQATMSTLNTISTNLIDTSLERESMSLLKTIGIMLEREKPEDLPRQIVVAAASILKADVTALLVVDDAEYGDVLAAYDNVQQRPIAAMALKLDEQPTLQSALREKVQKSLTVDKNLNEMVDLYTRLDIQKVGPVYFQPLTREGDVVGVMVVALPFTQRELRENERRLLDSLAPAAARLLTISRAAKRAVLEAQTRSVQALVEGEPTPDVAVTAQRAEMQASLELARAQINELSGLVRDLQIELDYERSRIAELAENDPDGLSITQRLERLTNERTRLEAERERLMKALQEAQAQLAAASGHEDEGFQAIVEVLQREKEELYAQKRTLEEQLAQLRSAGGGQASAMMREVLTRMSEEKARFVVERDQLRAQLSAVEQQLAALGIEGGSTSLITTLVSLTDERSQYKALAEKAAQERDALRAELQRYTTRIQAEDERDARISSLQNDLKRLAEDREVLTRQRDSLRQERDTLLTDRNTLESVRTKMVAELAAVQSDLEAALFERNRAAAERDKLIQERAILLSERDKLAAGRAALQNERDQLLARVEGNRERLTQLGAEGVDTLRKMIDELTEERSELEHQLLAQKAYADKLKERLDDATRKLKGTERSGLNVESLEVMLSLAQELRTPLSVITAYVDLLIQEKVGILGELQRQFLQRVQSNAGRLGQLVEEFVRIVALDTGQLRLKLEPTSLSAVIEEAIDATRPQFGEKGISLSLNLADTLPILQADKEALRQVVVELLSNAYRATPTDGEVWVSATFAPAYRMPARKPGVPNGRPVDALILKVKDFGGGIPAEEQARVFTRLHRADSPLIQGLGDTGVGLSIARSLVEAHKGRIWLESEPGQSTTFSVALPLQPTLDTGEKAQNAAS